MNILGNLHMIPALAPIDTTSTATIGYSDVVDAGGCSEIEFDLYIGVITGDVVVVTAYADANTSTGGGTAIPFRYKLSAATGTDTSAAWTYVASTGLSVPEADDGMLLRVNIDPADVAAAATPGPYCYIGMDPGSSISAFVHSVTCVTVPRYNQSTPSSLVD